MGLFNSALNFTIELQWVEVLKLLLYNIVVLKVHVTTFEFPNLYFVVLLTIKYTRCERRKLRIVL